MDKIGGVLFDSINLSYILFEILIYNIPNLISPILLLIYLLILIFMLHLYILKLVINHLCFVSGNVISGKRTF